MLRGHFFMVLCAKVRISSKESTLTRRKNSGNLFVDESERVIRFASLFDGTNILMQGDKKAALDLLNSPLEFLGGKCLYSTPKLNSVPQMLKSLLVELAIEYPVDIAWKAHRIFQLLVNITKVL
jgi:hypothetical protein